MELHEWKKILHKLDFFLILLVFILLGSLRADILMLFAFVFAFGYLTLTKRRVFLAQLCLSFVISLLWMLLAKSHYDYNTTYLSLFGLNTFPLLAWSIGLFALYIIYSHYEHLFYEHSFARKLVYFTFIYWPLLLLAETIGYHFFNIQNKINAIYSGLPLCDCIHAPSWMQISYFLIGIVYFFLIHYLKFENPHIKKAHAA